MSNETPLADAAAKDIASFDWLNAPSNGVAREVISEAVTRHTHADEMLGLLREFMNNFGNHVEDCALNINPEKGDCDCHIAATEKLLRELGKETT